MKYLSFKNRIALSYILSTALLIGLIFGVLYWAVQVSVYRHLDEDLKMEMLRHAEYVVVEDGKIALDNHQEWLEREHNTLGVDPVFVEFTDKEGQVIDKSPNLKTEHLRVYPNFKQDEYYESVLLGKRIRQAQIPIVDEANELAGYLLVAISLEGRLAVLNMLSHVFLISFPLVLIILFFVARVIAGRSIQPIKSIIDTSNQITRDNLTTRIPLPSNRDELYVLSQTINRLLDRLEQVVEREKRFTSYASHEFRTPLAVVKGTLEVLVRRPRSQKEYSDKVDDCIKEIDRMDLLIDQLLLLTREENHKRTIQIKEIRLRDAVDVLTQRFQQNEIYQDIKIVNNVSSRVLVHTDSYLFSIVLGNLLSNALKYSKSGGIVDISFEEDKSRFILIIQDQGMGMCQADLIHIFDDFYRSKQSSRSEITGFGLGLPIVKRLCMVLGLDVSIKSVENQGTQVYLAIPK